jgi:hypothetical protein
MLRASIWSVLTGTAAAMCRASMMEDFSRLNAPPACSPVNGSPTASRLPTHDSGYRDWLGDGRHALPRSSTRRTITARPVRPRPGVLDPSGPRRRLPKHTAEQSSACWLLMCRTKSRMVVAAHAVEPRRYAGGARPTVTGTRCRRPADLLPPPWIAVADRRGGHVRVLRSGLRPFRSAGWRAPSNDRRGDAG